MAYSVAGGTIQEMKQMVEGEGDKEGTKKEVEINWLPFFLHLCSSHYCPIARSHQDPN